MRGALAAACVLVATVLVAPALGRATFPAPDPTFGPGGQRFARNILGALGEDGVELEGLRILPDGRLVALAQDRCGMGCRSEVVAPYTAAGQPDASFGGAGSAGVASFAKMDDAGPQLQGIVVRDDGSIVLGYDVIGTSAPTLVVVAGDGRTRTEVGLPRVFAPAAVLPGGALLGLSGRDVVRLRPDLTVDTTFGSAGAARLPAAITVPDGLVATRRTIAIGGSDRRGFVLARLSPAGRTLGARLLSIPGVVPGSVLVTQTLARPNGGTLLVGRAWPRRGDRRRVTATVIGAFRADGRPDLRFGRRGLLRLSESDATVAVARDGRAVVLSSVAASPPAPLGSGGARLVLRRFGADGRPDRSAPNRRVRTRASLFAGLGVGIDRRGRIIAAGGAYTTYTRSGLLLARFRDAMRRGHSGVTAAISADRSVTRHKKTPPLAGLS